jgi:hypothetical protein
MQLFNLLVLLPVLAVVSATGGYGGGHGPYCGETTVVKTITK